MNIEYTPVPPEPDAFTFGQLAPGTWYQGVQTGRLYFFYRGSRGESRLLRADDNCECTEGYRGGGTFRPVAVTVVVHARNARKASCGS